MDNERMSEIDTLRAMLRENDIPFESNIDKRQMHDLYADVDYRNQVIVRCPDEPEEIRVSCVCHFGSYGVQKGLIEFYDFFNEPTGFLTADEAFELVKEKWEEWK